MSNPTTNGPFNENSTTNLTSISLTPASVSSYQSMAPRSPIDSSSPATLPSGNILDNNTNESYSSTNGGVVNPNYTGYNVGPLCPDVAIVDGSSITHMSQPPTTVTSPVSDKIPLLSQSDFLRSLSGVVGRQGLLDLDNFRFGLSTFSGVFCPVALSMLSVLLYLRLGLVVGQAGILLSLCILTLAYGIILFTALSLCAVSTNGAIEGGGVYYMISRALGPEFGGSIGVLFFLANIFSCALSLAGLSEATINNFGPGGYMVSETIHALPTGHWYHFGYAFCISIVTLFVCLIGASLFAKTSLITLIVVGFTYLSFLLSLLIKRSAQPIDIPKDNPLAHENGTASFNYTGLSSTTFDENLYADWGFDYTTHIPMNFAYVFGVVFSGVTGLMAGANMSGDLKKPDVSIPKGTLQAIFGTFLLYSVTALLLASSCSRELLKNNYTVVQNINIWPPFIFIGIFATSLASAMSNLIGASRILHRVAEDKLFGAILFPFLKLMCNNNPVNAVLVSWVLVICVLLIGALNAIAQITSVFFLLCYAGVNLACLALDLTSAPNFRPTFYYFSWHTASLGFIGSIGMMFIINPGASGIAIISLLLILIGLHYKAPIPASWGSISQALIFHQVRKYLLMLDTRKEHVKYWRPQILLLVANPKSCLPLIDFVNDLKKSGLYVLGHVKLCSSDMLEADPLQEETPYWLGLIDYLKIKAFVDITVSTSVRQGVQNLVRLSGLGAMKPNTVIFGFRDQTPSLNTFRDNKLFSKKNLKFAKLDRAEVVEYFTARDLPTSSSQPSLFLDSDSLDIQRSMDAEPKVSAVEYVHIIADVLRMNKNICLARHFHKLDKEALFGKSSTFSPDQERFIDVWPVDLIRPQNASTSWDNSSLFLLQLACILSMVDVWKAKTTLRVFLCVTSLQDMQRKELQLKEMLGQLRIQAKSILLPWDHVICHVATDRSTDDLTKMPETYLRSFNDLLQKNSGRSSVIFLNMPLPVINFTDQQNFPSECETYLKCLETLTDHLPPILLVHGISSVISTAL